MSLQHIPKKWLDLGYAGEKMLDHFLHKKGYRETHLPAHENYHRRVEEQKIDNWIIDQKLGRINFEVKNFNNRTKMPCNKMIEEIIFHFYPRFNYHDEICILIISYKDCLTKKGIAILERCCIPIIEYRTQVLPNDEKTFTIALSNLWRSQLPLILNGKIPVSKPKERIEIGRDLQGKPYIKFTPKLKLIRTPTGFQITQ